MISLIATACSKQPTNYVVDKAIVPLESLMFTDQNEIQISINVDQNISPYGMTTFFSLNSNFHKNYIGEVYIGGQKLNFSTPQNVYGITTNDATLAGKEKMFFGKTLEVKAGPTFAASIYSPNPIDCKFGEETSFSKSNGIDVTWTGDVQSMGTMIVALQFNPTTWKNLELFPAYNQMISKYYTVREGDQHFKIPSADLALLPTGGMPEIHLGRASSYRAPNGIKVAAYCAAHFLGKLLKN